MEQNNNQEVSKTEQPYDPNRVLNYMLEKYSLRNDAALSRLLEVAPPIISKIRHRKIPIGASLLIRMSDISGTPTRDLRNIMGDRRKNYRISDLQGRPVQKDIRPAPEQKDYTPDAAYAVAV